MTEKTKPDSLPDLFTIWEADSIAELSTSTQRRYRAVFGRFLTWFTQMEQRPPTLADLHPITLVGYRGMLQETLAATSTINTHLSALRSWCEWLTQQGYLETNPAARLKLVGRTEEPAPAALEPKQVNALLRAVQRTRYPLRNNAIVQMMIQTGMRIGECAALQWGDIEMGERKGRVRIRSGKGDKTRFVPLNQSARQALADYAAPLLEVEPRLKAVATVWQNVDALEPLWKSERSTPLSIREMSRMIGQAIQQTVSLGLVPAEATPHSLRHTFATRYLLRHPGDLVGLARLLGHTSIQTTQIYVQPTEAEMARRVSQIDLNAYAR